ncbi:MAG: hypothetical protein A2W93_09640 [Bacteroidetes bacterium GWF2_43_63]|nr:MAG: hypothetical protein A2W94_07125 [Bacteroidetes bacterium GWE2_42_42]OFY54569.1 MAG: hypothetical protein A2W93_09640 [Bacteroidetes bacterium GWF2_43_63]HBG70621.1 hypothetical protein [Bacteroidales bacterium]HCB60918.1 hypothetical protein [Bacteroidales bacterium]
MAEISFHTTYSDNQYLFTRVKNGSQRGLQRRGCHRFGFNGKENDNEVKGTGNQQDYGMRIYDPRLGRFLSADPLIVQEQKYPELSPYQFASNRPIDAIDLDGLEMTSVIINDEYTGSIYGAGISGGYEDVHVPENVQRGAGGVWKIASGISTALGGIAFGVVTCPTGAGPVIGGAIFVTGSYTTVQGFRQLANLVEGGDASEDPQYSTPVGEISESKTADDVTGLLLGRKVGSVNTVVDIVNQASTFKSYFDVGEDLIEGTQSMEAESSSSSSQSSTPSRLSGELEHANSVTKSVYNALIRKASGG